MDVREWIIAGTALYGAVLATVTHLSTRKSHRPRVVVSTSLGFPVFGADVGDPSVIVEAGNKGRVPVIVSSFGLRLPNGDSVVCHRSWSPGRLPAELSPGQSHTVGESARALALSLAENGYKGVIKIVGFCKTAVGDEYRSKPSTFDVNGWLRGATSTA